MSLLISLLLIRKSAKKEIKVNATFYNNFQIDNSYNPYKKINLIILTSFI